MKEILNSQSSRHLNCIPLSFLYVDNMVKRSKIYLQCYVSGRAKAIRELTPDSSDGRVYGSQGITRFYADFEDKSPDIMAAKVTNLKRIWDKRDVYFVEGEYTRCGVGNDLFDNAISVHRVICPSTNAFDKYEEIVEAVKKNVPRDENVIVLCALGPTATVLAYDFSQMGYQAIDLGHIDIEYEWYLVGAPYKQPVTGKAVNERGVNHV